MKKRFKRRRILPILIMSMICSISAFPVSAAPEGINNLPAAERIVAHNIVKRIKGINRKAYKTPPLTRSQAIKIERAINHDFFLYGYNPLRLTFDYEVVGMKNKAISHTFKWSRFQNENMLVNKQLGVMANKVVRTCIKRGMSKKQQINAVNRYICSHFSYRQTNSENFLPLLKKWQGSCYSYSALFHSCMVKLHIRSRTISGRIVPNNLHAWNEVRIGKKWYQIDVCWNDGCGDYNAYGLTRGNLKKHIYDHHDDVSNPAYYTHKSFIGYR